MSLNLPKVQAVKVLDPRLALNSKREYVVLKGSLVNSWQQFPATTINNSQIQITCNPPSRDIAVSRLVFINTTWTATITGTNSTFPASTLIQPGFFAPRAYPYQCVVNSEQMTFNNDTITQAPKSQYWPALLWYHNKFDNRYGQASLTPSYMDQAQNYVDSQNSVRNPLATHFNNSYEQTRGGFSGMVIQPQLPGNVSATVNLNITEPLILSPLEFHHGSNFHSCLIGIQNMAYTATLGNLSRLFSLTADQGTLPPVGPPTINITSVSVQLNSASLLFEYLTPDPVMPIPRELVSSYFSLVSYPTRSSAPIAPGGSVSLTMQSVQVTSIPRRMYIFSRMDDSAQTAFTSDAYFSLNSSANPLTVTWNNNQFFSQSTSMDLYNMSVKNGFGGSWDQWNKYTGSVLCIDFGTDLGLMSQEAPGALGNYQLGLTAQFINVNSVLTIAPTLYVVLVYEGTFNVINGNCSHDIGVLSHQDVLESKMDPLVTYKQVEHVYGGDFFDSIRNAFHKAHDFVKSNKLVSGVAKLIPHPVAQAISKGAEHLGYGVSGGRKKKKRGGVLVGDGYSGGKRMSAKQLRHMIRGGSLEDEQECDESESDQEEMIEFE